MDLVLLDDYVATVKMCPQGHPMVGDNVKVRWERTSFYPRRECQACIRERRVRRPRRTEEQKAAHRAYMKARREGTFQIQKQVITPDEREALVQRHARRLATVGMSWAGRKARLRRDDRARVDAYHVTRETMMAARGAQEVAVAMQDPDLAALIVEQARDAVRFRIARPAIFVEQDRADALLYGTVYAFES